MLVVAAVRNGPEFGMGVETGASAGIAECCVG